MPRSRCLQDAPQRAALALRLAIAAVLLAVLLPACSSGAGGAPAGSAPGAEPPRVARVTTAPVSLRDVSHAIEATGSVEAEEQVQVVAGVEGVVVSVRFREGDPVTPESVLATIDPERYRVQAERAQANHDKIQAQYRQALADLARREELTRQQPPLVSEEEVERARQEAERLKATVAEARALYELAEQDRRRSIVRPLVPGVIDRKSVSVGQHVDAETVLASLVDARRLRLRFRVSEQDSVRLRDGMEVRFTTASRPGRDFAARIFHVASSADSTTRMVECLARVGDHAGLLKPGFSADVRAEVETRRGAVVVAERAVLPTERGFLVYEVRDGRAVERRVTLGLRTGDGSVEVLDGLQPGAIVVVDGGSALRDGTPVEAGTSGAAPATPPAAAPSAGPAAGGSL